MTLQGLHIDGFLYGIKFADNMSADDTKVIDVAISDSVIGYEKGTTAAINTLAVTGGSITNGYIGFDFAKTVTAGQSGVGNADGVVIDGTAFSNLDAKGIYVETLSNSHITNITMNNVGQYGAGSSFGTQGSGGNGIDLNLKNGSYSNVEIDNFHLTDTGFSNRNGLDAQRSQEWRRDCHRSPRPGLALWHRAGFVRRGRQYP